MIKSRRLTPAKAAAKDFLAEVAALAAACRQSIEAGVDGFSPDPDQSQVRRAKAAASYQFFAQTYFPHYTQYSPSAMHQWLFGRLNQIGMHTHDKVGLSKTRGARLAVLAPRGEAKSTMVTQIFTLWCVLTGRKHFVPIIMDSFPQAATMLEAIKAELEFNPRLAMDFPEQVGQGRLWQAGVILTAGGAKLQAFGSGTKIRGIRHGQHRPDLAILDDLENDENVATPAQRHKLEQWVKKSVLALGPKDDSMDVVYVGTLLHYDSVLARFEKNPLWESKRFSAILSWPARMDLWDRWEAILLSQGEAAAQSFYDTCPGESAATVHPMQLGAEVSWPAAIPLYQLMFKRARDGHDAFDSEQQNTPVAGNDAIFSDLIKAPSTYYSELPQANQLSFFGAVDPSLGLAGTGRDPSAILVGAWHAQSSTLYIVEANIRKRLPDLIIDDVIRLQKQYSIMLWVVETVQFQQYFRAELVKQSTQRGIPVAAQGITPHANKQLRIETLQPPLAHGHIKLHHSHGTLLEQLRHFPAADHDDGPDALHMLYMLASKYTPAANTIEVANFEPRGW